MDLSPIFRARAKEFVQSGVSLSMAALGISKFNEQPQPMTVTGDFVAELSLMLTDYMYQSEAAGRVQIPDELKRANGFEIYKELVVDCLKKDTRITAKFTP